MNRRDFCRLMAAGAAGAMTGELFFSTDAQAVVNDLWANWFCKYGPPHPPKYHLTDSHFHFFDFVQRTDGAQALLNAMDANWVDHIMFSGMPLVKKWGRSDLIKPTYYLDNNSPTYWYSATDMIVANTFLNNIPKDQQYRFHPFMCGFNSTDLYAVEHVERMLGQYGHLWQGIGEVFSHRDDLTNLVGGETPRGDHPALMKIYKKAAEMDLPVVIHNNVSSRGRPADLLYLTEVKQAVAGNPDTRFIWAHAGLGRYFEQIVQDTYTKELRKLLEDHGNLHIDLSWLVFEDYIAPDPFKGPLPAWLELITSMPDRFLIGTDCIGHFDTAGNSCEKLGMGVRHHKYAFNIRKFYVLLDKLKPTDRLLVGRNNFLNLLPKRVREEIKRREG